VKTNRISFSLTLTGLALIAVVPAWAQDILPFPDLPMGGKIAPTMQESVHKWREVPSHLPEDAPNILIVMLDDAGFGQCAVNGGVNRLTTDDHQLSCPKNACGSPNGVLELWALHRVSLSDSAKRS